MLTKFTNLAEFQKSFSTELKCIKYLIALRWNNQPQCPRCNKQGKGIYTLKKRLQ